MNRFFYIVLFLLCGAARAYAQERAVGAFIPAGYDTLTVARGDLNNDGKEDVAIVLYSTMENQDSINVDSIPPRLLIILFKTPNGYIEAAKSSTAILCKDCLMNAFQGMEIENGILNIEHYGGVNLKWAATHHFQFLKNDFYLIGQNIWSFKINAYCNKLDEFKGNTENINFITGEYHREKISENCKRTKSSGKQAVKPLVPLSKFDINNNY